MTDARQSQIRQKRNTYYHVVSRAVRRAWLYGEDVATGRDYSHRKQWIVDRVDLLSKNFAVDICAYAVMSNHYHLVLHLDYERSLTWSAEEVVLRWWKIFTPKWLKTDPEAENKNFHLKRLASDEAQVALWRERLADLSWFMRCLNEPIARMANKEDGCKGRFWEGRFKSQLLLDNAALLTCMAYVDLNPVRAQMAPTPEESDYTSIAARIEEKQQVDHKHNTVTLVPFAGNYKERLHKKLDDSALLCLPIEQDEYLKLVDWTGRQIKEGKRGAIPSHLAPILQRLEINDNAWVEGVEHFGRHFYQVIGLIRHMMTERIEQGKRWFKGQQAIKKLFQ